MFRTGQFWGPLRKGILSGTQGIPFRYYSLALSGRCPARYLISINNLELARTARRIWSGLVSGSSPKKAAGQGVRTLRCLTWSQS